LFLEQYQKQIICQNLLQSKTLAVFRNNSKPTSALNFGETDYHEPKRGEKIDLPLRRGAFETEVKIAGAPLHVVVSEYEDGTPGQIAFLSYKQGSDLGATLTTSGVQASRALKRGIELEDVVEGWRGHQFNPQGFVEGHPHIHTALSPLDFAAKLLRLEYLGDTQMAEEPEKVDVTDLRGFKSGAFRTFERRKIDDWDFEQVIKDPEFGGFEKPEKDSLLAKIPKNGLKLNNERGVQCRECGRTMQQTAPGCYKCICSNSIGGCGM
jgi:hypothetical protein